MAFIAMGLDIVMGMVLVSTITFGIMISNHNDPFRHTRHGNAFRHNRRHNHGYSGYSGGQVQVERNPPPAGSVMSITFSPLLPGFPSINSFPNTINLESCGGSTVLVECTKSID